ncbi:c-type cytochrome [Thiohalospira halophila]|uniref:c-type cytochrome n=1 Tax=Thiohalospira halophila TaxID=381300 RepID=UPI001F073503|nr:c-type cytochrome [Thiohalospira halophila]
MKTTNQQTPRYGRRTALVLAATLLVPAAGMAQQDETLTEQVELEEAPEAGSEGYHDYPGMDELPDGEFGEAVRSGMEAFVNTRQHPEARRHVGNGQNCANCHLGSGMAANSAPVWGAWGIYPKYRGKNDHVNTMDERIRGCFTYSMNAKGSEAGAPPEPDSQLLKDMQSFMFWAAQGAPIGENLPGRGYRSVEEPEDGYSISRGESIYEAQCAICHAEDGSGKFTADGEQIFPPLWGEKAYNWGAGMHRINTAAGFIKYNMPLGKANPVEKHAALSDQEAWDVSAYINSHERPQDPRWEGDKATTEENWHTHKCLYNHEAHGHTLGEGTE